MTALGEDDLIARYFAPLAGPGGLGLLDDAALVAVPEGQELVVTADALVAGVHFFPDDPPGSISRKALGVNLSDLASKGARPLGFVLSLALAPGWTAEWLEGFASGLGAMATSTGCLLLGGDTVRTPGPLVLSITAFGLVPAGRMVRRTGARPGDRLYVSGTIGDAALGLGLRMKHAREAIEDAADTMLIDRYLHPQPRLPLAPVLLDHASGAMDVSDGLVGDLRKMMRASGVTATVELARVPLSAAARRLADRDPAAFATALTGGDDYEILATVPAGLTAGFEVAAAAAGMSVTAIGTVEAGTEPVRFLDAGGQPVGFERGSFQHF